MKLFIKVKANARRSAVRTIFYDGLQERLEIAVHAMPEKGKANDALIAFLGSILGIAKSNICIIKGTTLPLKEVVIYNMDHKTVVERLTPSS